MAEATDSGEITILLYSDDSLMRREVMNAVGIRPGKGMPKIKWIEAATDKGALMKYEEAGKVDLLIFDGETQKVGGMALLRLMEVEIEEPLPPSIILVARQQDEWLAKLAGTTSILHTPLDPVALQEEVVRLLS